ncbi:MAG: protein kinase [Acidobacteriota bacterium]
MGSFLVVERDERTVAQIRSVAAAQGYEVTVSHDPAVAVAMAAELRPKLVLADASLPGAVDFLFSFSKRRGGCGSLALRPMMADISGLEQAADRSLGKPFTPEQLGAAISELLGGGKQRPSALETQQLTSAEIFGDLLSDLGDEGAAPPQAAASPAAPSPPPAAPSPTPAPPAPAAAPPAAAPPAAAPQAAAPRANPPAAPQAPAPQRPAPPPASTPASPTPAAQAPAAPTPAAPTQAAPTQATPTPSARKRPQSSSIDQRLEQTLSGVLDLGNSGRRKGPQQTPSSPGSAPSSPAAGEPPKAPRQPAAGKRKSSSAQEIDALLSKTLSGLDIPKARKRPAPAAPPPQEPATTPAPTSPAEDPGLETIHIGQKLGDILEPPPAPPEPPTPSSAPPTGPTLGAERAPAPAPPPERAAPAPPAEAAAAQPAGPGDQAGGPTPPPVPSAPAPGIPTPARPKGPEVLDFSDFDLEDLSAADLDQADDATPSIVEPAEALGQISEPSREEAGDDAWNLDSLDLSVDGGETDALTADANEIGTSQSITGEGSFGATPPPLPRNPIAQPTSSDEQTGVDDAFDTGNPFQFDAPTGALPEIDLGAPQDAAGDAFSLPDLEPISADLTADEAADGLAAPPSLDASSNDEAALLDTSSLTTPEPGRRFGPYTLLERIAVGGMAEVWKARMDGVAGFQKTVAIKKVLPNLTENKAFETMFVDEAKLAAELSHPHIVDIYDLGEIHGEYYIAMEYVEGKDLRSLFNIAQRKAMPLPLPLALMIASRLASALDYAHRKRDPQGQELGLVHRDVSPQNVLLSHEGDIKLCDFGIVKAVSKASKTEMGALKGKLQYMAPEQAWGREVDSRADIFALGSLTFEMLTGERLFAGETELAVLEMVRSATIRTPRELDPRIPEDVQRAVLRALAQDPENRFQRASEMRDALEACHERMTVRPSSSDLGQYLESLLAAEEADEETLAAHAAARAAARAAADLGAVGISTDTGDGNAFDTPESPFLPSEDDASSSPASLPPLETEVEAEEVLPSLQAPPVEAPHADILEVDSVPYESDHSSDPGSLGALPATSLPEPPQPEPPQPEPTAAAGPLIPPAAAGSESPPQLLDLLDLPAAPSPEASATASLEAQPSTQQDGSGTPFPPLAAVAPAASDIDPASDPLTPAPGAPIPGAAGPGATVEAVLPPPSVPQAPEKKKRSWLWPVLFLLLLALAAAAFFLHQQGLLPAIPGLTSEVPQGPAAPVDPAAPNQGSSTPGGAEQGAEGESETPQPSAEEIARELMQTQGLTEEAIDSQLKDQEEALRRDYEQRERQLRQQIEQLQEQNQGDDGS